MSMSINNNYKLLPFKFTRLSNKELLVNEVGDYILLPYGTTHKIINREISSKTELYRDLLSKFIITEKYDINLIEILSTRLRTKKSFLDNFTALHIFVLTLRCNQKCVYCQASSQDKLNTQKDMKYEYLDRAIDLMFMSPNPCITMEFQGGEASLVPELIEYAVNKTELLNETFKKDIRFVICSNLINFSDKLIDLCFKHNIFISTSLDGPSILHNYNRGSLKSYNTFVSNLNKIREKIDSSMISPLMTTSDLSLSYPLEIVDSYRALGFKAIFLRPLNPYGRSKNHENWEEYIDQFLEFYKKALNYIIEINLKGEYFVESFTAFMMKKILTPFPIGFVDLQSPAGIINSVIVYNYDGNVYCSDESRMLAEHGDYHFKLGSVFDNYIDLFYGEKAQKLAQVWATEYIAGCSDCAFQQYCGADPVRNYTTQGDEYGNRPSSLFCKFHKKVFEYLFEMIDLRKDEVLQVFRSWIFG